MERKRTVATTSTEAIMPSGPTGPTGPSSVNVKPRRTKVVMQPVEVDDDDELDVVDEQPSEPVVPVAQLSTKDKRMAGLLKAQQARRDKKIERDAKIARIQEIEGHLALQQTKQRVIRQTKARIVDTQLDSKIEELELKLEALHNTRGGGQAGQGSQAGQGNQGMSRVRRQDDDYEPSSVQIAAKTTTARRRNLSDLGF